MMAKIPDESAPLPWLGDPEEAATATQTWTLPNGEGALQTLHFKLTTSDQLHITLYLFWVRLPALALGSMEFGLFFAGLMSLLISGFKWGTIPILLVAQIFAGAAIGFFLWMCVFLPPALAVASLFVGWFAKQITFTLMADGIHMKGFGKPRTRKWSEIGRIEERKGYVYFILKASHKHDHVIPPAAFPDDDARKRFHATAVALWKSNGSSDAMVTRLQT